MPLAPIDKADLLSRLAEGHAAGVTVVTPNRRLAAELAREFDERQIASGLAVWEDADILPFGAFVARLYEDALYSERAGEVPGGGRARELRGGRGRARLCRLGARVREARGREHRLGATSGPRRDARREEAEAPRRLRLRHPAAADAGVLRSVRKDRNRGEALRSPAHRGKGGARRVQVGSRGAGGGGGLGARAAGGGRKKDRRRRPRPAAKEKRSGARLLARHAPRLEPSRARARAR